jgi:hypothetical protein
LIFFGLVGRALFNFCPKGPVRVPAAKRYTKSQLEKILARVMKLPNGTPPEPTFTKDEAAEWMAAQVRRRVLEDHVEIADIVKEMNADGLNVAERKFGQLVKSANESKRGRNKGVPPVRGHGGSRTIREQGKPPEARANGLLNIDRDEDEI